MRAGTYEVLDQPRKGPSRSALTNGSVLLRAMSHLAAWAVAAARWSHGRAEKMIAIARLDGIHSRYIREAA
jgi:hypothetical protein